MKGSTTCFLCGTKPAIENSHILPKLIVRAIAKEIGKPGLREMSKPRLRVEKTTVVPLLCKECEAQFQKYESDFARCCLRPYLKNERIQIEHNAKLQAFAVSVLWRVLRHTLNQNVPPGRQHHLICAEKTWRSYLLSKKPELGEHKCYLFLDREFSEDHVKSSYCLNYVDLRFTIEQGVTTVTNFMGVPYRQIVYAKLGPFIFVGTVHDIFRGQMDHLMTPWRELTSRAQTYSAVDDGMQVPDEIAETIDNLGSRWGRSEDDFTQERRKELLAEFDEQGQDTMLKRLYEKNETLFRGASRT